MRAVWLNVRRQARPLKTTLMAKSVILGFSVWVARRQGALRNDRPMDGIGVGVNYDRFSNLGFKIASSGE